MVKKEKPDFFIDVLAITYEAPVEHILDDADLTLEELEAIVDMEPEKYAFHGSTLLQFTLDNYLFQPTYIEVCASSVYARLLKELKQAKDCL